MADHELLKPKLYRDGSPPELLGGACACGYVFFPLQAYGCERCGRTALEARPLAGRGKLLASARVHLHAGKSRQAPFSVGAIALDDGPIVRTLILEGDRPPVPGARMIATLVDVVDAEGAPARDLRFAAEAA